MVTKFYSLNKIIFIIIIQLFFLQNSYSDIIKKFEILGNDRITNETIIMFSSLNIGDEINENSLNEALKNLYYTDYFKNVELSVTDKTVIIKVTENPIIQSIIIEGIKRDSVYDKIKEITSKSEKYPFKENKINEQIIYLKNILKSNPIRLGMPN